MSVADGEDLIACWERSGKGRGGGESARRSRGDSSESLPRITSAAFLIRALGGGLPGVTGLGLFFMESCTKRSWVAGDPQSRCL